MTVNVEFLFFHLFHSSLKMLHAFEIQSALAGSYN